MAPATFSESNVDVLIIGAGPAGFMCANGLARAGVDVRIVDKRPAKIPAGQADGIQPRTIEVLQSYGLAERLLREGNHMHMAAFYNPGPDGGIERTHRAPDVTAPTARYPFEVTLHQGAIEQIFLDSLANHGVHIDRPMVPVSIDIDSGEAVLADPSSYAVKVVLKHLTEDGEGPLEDAPTEVVHAKYVVGCDGAHSWVRKTLGITMDGEQTEYVWGVVDTVPETNFPDIRNKTAIHSNNGACLVIPREGDVVRLYMQLSDKDFIVNGRVDRSKMGPARLLEVAKQSLKPYEIKFPAEVDWWTIYIIGQRVASSFSAKERVFIAGDACHTHSPKAGQGMNASMNDTHNLIWKLTHVIRGWAQPKLLKTYEFERRKYAQDLIEFDKQWSSLFSGKPYDPDNNSGVTHEQFLKVFQTFGDFSSGIGIHYAESVIVNASHQHIANHLVVGKRVPPQIFLRAADARPFEIQDLLPSDTRFKILVFTGDTNSALQRETITGAVGQLEKMLSSFVAEQGKHLYDIFDLIGISSCKKDAVNFTDMPKLLRPHWSKPLTDDCDVSGKLGGGGYATYGISPVEGAIVVVRPDGYVGLVVPLDRPNEVDGYFSKFLNQRS